MGKINNELLYKKQNAQLIDPETTWVGNDPRTGKTITICAASLFGQIFDLELLGQSCIQYPEVIVQDCETGEDVVMPLQLVQVILRHEELLCQILDQINLLIEQISDLRDDVTVLQDLQNNPPFVSAGANQLVTLPTNNVILSAISSDSDGVIVSHLWELIIGTGAVIVSPNSQTTNVTGLEDGHYLFQITVTDNKGYEAKDIVGVHVNGVPNLAPIVDAGANQSITLPTSDITLQAIANDPDGTIVSYLWEKISGGSAMIMASASANTQVTGLQEGNYTFRVTVTDNDGATASDTMNLVVVAANQPPVSIVQGSGQLQTINLPVTNFILDGSLSSDSDGSIVTYLWEQINGTPATIVDPNVPVTQVTGLGLGSYVFRLTVTDDDGATDFDQVTITVQQAPALPIQIIQTTCGNVMLPPTFIDVYVDSLPILNGDTIYADANRNSSYNGLGQDFVYLGGTPDIEFIISSTGVVSSITSCPTGGGEGIISTDSTVNNSCITQRVVTVNVPSGQTIHVDISPAGTGASPNITETITSNKTYTLLVDGATDSQNLFTGSVDMETRLNNASGALQGQVTITRDHSGINC